MSDIPDTWDLTHVLVTGSRSWAGWDSSHRPWKPTKREYWQAQVLFGVLNGMLDEMIANLERMVLIHGHCPTGADALADHWGQQRVDVTVERHPADWATHGKRAGFIRNAEMIDRVKGVMAIVLAFWDGESKGTKHTIDLAKKAGLEVCTFTF